MNVTSLQGEQGMHMHTQQDSYRGSCRTSMLHSGLPGHRSAAPSKNRALHCSCGATDPINQTPPGYSRRAVMHLPARRTLRRLSIVGVHRMRFLLVTLQARNLCPIERAGAQEQPGGCHSLHCSGPRDDQEGPPAMGSRGMRASTGSQCNTQRTSTAWPKGPTQVAVHLCLNGDRNRAERYWGCRCAAA